MSEAGVGDGGARSASEVIERSLAVLDAPSLIEIAARTADAVHALTDVAMASVLVQPADEPVQRARAPRSRPPAPIELQARLVPLLGADGHVVGALHAWIARDHPLAPGDAATIGYLARLAAVAIESRRAADGPQLGRVARMMHDLRTPLAAMLAWTWALKRGLDAPRTQRALEGIERSARTQAALLDEAATVVRGGQPASPHAPRPSARALAARVRGRRAREADRRPPQH